MEHFLPRFFIVGLLFLVFNVPAAAQKTTWSVNISPTISYRMPQFRALSEVVESVRNGEKAMHTFDFGIDFRTAINDHWYVGTSLLYSQKGFSNIHVAVPYQDARIPRTYLIDFTQNYLEVPFFVTRTVFTNDNFRVYPLAGINNSLLLSEKNQVAVRSGEIAKELEEKLSEPYLKTKGIHNLGVISGLGIQASVDPKTFVGLEAISKVMLTPLTDITSRSRRNLYSMGLNFRFIRTLR